MPGIDDRIVSERRYVSPAELRIIEDDDGRVHVRGYGAVFDEWSEDLGGDVGGFREQIAPGAFDRALRGADVRSLWNHDPNYVLGRTGSGTLALMVDQRGLIYDVIPPDAQWARDLVISIRRGDVAGASIGFLVVRDEWGEDEEIGITRRLLELELYDVGPVTFPAYPQTSAEARARAQELDTTPDSPEDGGEGDDAGDADSARARLDVRRRELDLLAHE